MNSQQERAIVLWLNQLSSNVENFASLYDGCVFSELLNAVDPLFFSMELAKQVKLQPDPQNIQRNLRNICEKIVTFRINYQCKLPDYRQIDIDEIAINRNKAEILALFEQILRVILGSQIKGQFIEPILKLDEQNQEILMHFLRSHLDDDIESQNIEQQDQWTFNQMLQKLDEVENQNIDLTAKLAESKEVANTLESSIKELYKQLETRENEIKAIQEQKIQIEQFLEEKFDQQNDLREFERIKQKCLEQEHKLATYELLNEEAKLKEVELKQVKEEIVNMRQQLRNQHQLEAKIEQLQERRELDKDIYERMREKQDQEITKLKSNIQQLLMQLSELKETRLNLELELQQKQAKIDKFQDQNKQIEAEYQEKIQQLEELMQTIRQTDQTEQQLQSQIEDSDATKLSQDIMMRMSNSKQDNLEIEYYIRENHKLEGRVKDLQKQLSELQLEQESKVQRRDLETQMHQTQQIQILNDQLRKLKDQNEILRKQNEDLRKQSQSKKVTQIDYELSILSLLCEALSKRVSESKCSSDQILD